MKEKIDWILRTIVMLMIIGAFIIIKKDVHSKYAIYYVIFSLVSLFLFFIYQILGFIINAIKVFKVTRSLKWIRFKDLILSFLRNLIILFVGTVILKYTIKHDVNVIGTLGTSIAITVGATISEFIYKAKTEKAKIN